MGHLAAALSDVGYRVYNIGYRRMGDDGGGYPGTFDDVSSAFQAVKRDILELGSDVSTITVAGHSAGGHLALWLASTDSTVGRVVGLAAISDLSEYARGSGSCQLATPRLMGGSPDEVPSAYSYADPSLLETPKAEVVLISADKDAIVPPAHNANYVEKKGAKHIVYPDVGHFDLVAPISRVWKDVLSVIGDR